MIGKRSRQVLTGRGDRLLVVYLCRLKVCRMCVAPFGTFWHLLAPIWAWEKKVPGSASSVQFMRTFSGVKKMFTFRAWLLLGTSGYFWVLLGTFGSGFGEKKENDG